MPPTPLVMASKLKFILPVVLLLIVGVGAKMTILAPKPATGKPKVEGTLVPLNPEFTVNLADGHFAKLTVALLLDPSSAPTAGGEGASGPPHLPQDSMIRSVITDRLTGLSESDLLGRQARRDTLTTLKRDLLHHTDTKIRQVLITDLTVS